MNCSDIGVVLRNQIFSYHHENSSHHIQIPVPKSKFSEEMQQIHIEEFRSRALYLILHFFQFCLRRLLKVGKVSRKEFKEMQQIHIERVQSRAVYSIPYLTTREAFCKSSSLLTRDPKEMQQIYLEGVQSRAIYLMLHFFA